MRHGVKVVFRDRAGAATVSRRPGDSSATAPSFQSVLEVIPAMSPRDEAVFLLHTAAEIEHSLMVQYLYAAWSLPDGPPRVQRWRRDILQIAREEMAHLAAVLNVLRFVGGPLNFDREDFPFRTALYPFPFRLERLHRASLARYVAAEMPAQSDVDAALIAEVVRLAKGEDGGGQVNRVGALYSRLRELLVDEHKLPDRLFRPDTADLIQARPARYRADVGRGPLYVRTVRGRGEALALLADVANQGEGEEEMPDSHFLTFVDIFDAWPADDAIALDVPTDPSVGDASDSGDQHLNSGLITHPRARGWALIFDLHYRMLLSWLQHALLTPTGAASDGLALRAFDAMFVLSDVGPFLSTLPRTRDGAGRAGAPFTLPYSLAFPDLPRDRWAHHRDLIETSRRQLDDLGAADTEIEEEISRRILGSAAAAESFVAEQADDIEGPA